MENPLVPVHLGEFNAISSLENLHQRKLARRFLQASKGRAHERGPGWTRRVLRHNHLSDWVKQEHKDGFMWKSVIAISLGAALGALLRWVFGIRLNALFPAIPPGTLAANLVGGYVVGVGIALFASYSALSPEWRLFLITGFCGGLTTFSTFSAEIVTLLQQGRAGLAMGAVAVHVIGSVLMTFAGIATVMWARA